MPRRATFHNESAGDPQTVLQDDKDPMLTVDPDYLDCRSDTDPAGDLGKSSTHRSSQVLTYSFVHTHKVVLSCTNVIFSYWCI